MSPPLGQAARPPVCPTSTGLVPGDLCPPLHNIHHDVGMPMASPPAVRHFVPASATDGHEGGRQPPMLIPDHLPVLDPLNIIASGGSATDVDSVHPRSPPAGGRRTPPPRVVTPPAPPGRPAPVVPARWLRPGEYAALRSADTNHRSPSSPFSRRSHGRACTPWYTPFVAQ